MIRFEVLDFLKENNLDVFPLKGKIPTCRRKEPFNGEIQLNENFGIKMGGKSKIIVIDVDDYSLAEYFKELLHTTYVVKTGKGFHIYIKVNTFPLISRLCNLKGQYVDIQSTGTYVVGETSIHPETKKEYQMISDKREINEVDFEEIKKILEKCGFNTIKNGIPEVLSIQTKYIPPKDIKPSENTYEEKIKCEITCNGCLVLYIKTNDMREPIQIETDDSKIESPYLVRYVDI